MRCRGRKGRIVSDYISQVISIKKEAEYEMTMTNSHVVCTFCAKLCDLDMAFLSRDKQAVRIGKK